jgi:hypothetical protein
VAKAQECEQCGSELPFNAPQGLCPRCLMRMGLSLKNRGSAKAEPPLAPTPLKDKSRAERKRSKLPQGGNGAQPG